MEFKNHIILIILVLVLIPSVSASISITDTLHNFEETATKYDNGEISVAQMIILLEHHHDEKQRKMNEENFPGWSKTELENALKGYKETHGYVMKTHDMQIFMGIYSDDEKHYDWGYSVGARRYTEYYYENQLADDIKSFKESLREAYLSNNPDFKELGVEFRDVLGPIYKLDYDECVNLMSSEMDEVTTDNLPSYAQKGGNYRLTPPKDGKLFKTTIYEDSKSECMEKCWFDADCEKICENYPNTLLLSGFCSEKVSYLSVTREGFRKDFFNFVQKISSARQSTPYTKECEPYSYEANLYFREKLQESLNKEFFDWYVNDFLGNDMEKYLNPTSSFERLMGFFHQTSQQVSNSLNCKGQNEWPDEFEKVNVDYKNGNVEFHIWEELKSVSHKNVDMWSTLYKYKIMGDKDMMKKLIEHQLSDKSTIAPPANEIEVVKQDEKAMTVLDKLTSGFGDSLDFEISLKDGNENVFTRYVTINEDIIFKVSNSQTNAKESELDFAATLTLDNLYDFANTMTSIDSEKVYGPSWVETKEPMMIGKRIGLFFKLWNSVDVDPWTTKLKLSTKIGKILDYMKSMNPQSEEEEKMIAELNTQIDKEGNIKQQESIPDETEETETTSYQPEEKADAKSDKISFKVEMTYQGETVNTEYKARNLDSDAPDFKVISDDGSQKIVLGSEQISWYTYETLEGEIKWEQDANVWKSTWDMQYTNQFLPFYNKALKAEDGEYTASGESGGVRIYDINEEPNFSESVFQPN